MLAKTAPMGWNSWNTFGSNISEKLIFEMADVMANEGYKDAGYEYLVIDDCWSLRERDENGKLVADPEKFPHGMKTVADYVHSKGLKFGMYSCAGVRTCAGYPSSFDHEYVDAETFASWGVDFLKYDFCNFPENGDCKMRYLTMSQALKSTGREILFSACNWGREDPWFWMKSVGAHMYRSTGDILDNFRSYADIVRAQLDKFCCSGAGCYNDIDMLTVGMYGNGNAAIGSVCTDEEYRMEFAFWCMLSAPLMMGGDLRKLNPYCKNLLLNKDLIAINQDEESRPPYIVRKAGVSLQRDPSEVKDGEWPWYEEPDSAYTLLKFLSDGSFILGYFNLAPKEGEILCSFTDCGIPYGTSCGIEMVDVFTGENIGVKRDYFNPRIPRHDCRLYHCRIVK